ncbi:MAG: FAD-dependent monooxygenase [Pirellulaceae bacterium]
MTRSPSPTATISLDDAARDDWELVVLGAGPAGAMTAREAARQGIRVLLVDRSRFPRPKVCGCCVNQAALGVLTEAGLGDVPTSLGGRPLRAFQLASQGRLAEVPLGGGVAVSREQLDAALIEAAIEAGAQFLDATQALLRPALDCRIELKRQHAQRTIAARLAIVATGLGSRCVATDTPDARHSSPRSRIGAGAVIDEQSDAYASGIIYMACHRSGYVGLVRLEDGRLDIAAALDPAAVKRLGGIPAAVSQVIEQSGLPPISGLKLQDWHGTAKLTQHRPALYGDGYLVVGDAAGYVEPFTGEGIAWALATGKAVVPYAVRAMAEPDALKRRQVGASWSREHQRLVGRRMAVCRSVSFLLRRPRLVRWAVWALARRPQLAAPLEWSLNAPFTF